MRTESRMPFGLTLITLLGLAFTGWTLSRPALAQDNNAPQPPPGGRRMMMGGPASLAAAGDFVYVLRGNTVYQMRATDLSLVTQKDLPAPSAPGAPPGGAAPGQ